ncbi:hypothetical protein Krac_5535 [Ktedonobacter racemifer DSM 44963]|uniref:Uncharacterized protein n=1 Tax=Ktedonobacter racemifer DSM 44963 TaxID=485913 RepID=D6TW96_KTERA|nr:hypothetical protein Krac_5535 [Ktedonobacter racemifer DSM 44963]
MFSMIVFNTSGIDTQLGWLIPRIAQRDAGIDGSNSPFSSEEPIAFCRIPLMRHSHLCLSEIFVQNHVSRSSKRCPGRNITPLVSCNPDYSEYNGTCAFSHSLLFFRDKEREEEWIH